MAMAFASPPLPSQPAPSDMGVMNGLDIALNLLPPPPPPPQQPPALSQLFISPPYDPEPRRPRANSLSPDSALRPRAHSASASLSPTTSNAFPSPSPTITSPKRYYAPTPPLLPSEPIQRARTVSISHLAPTLVFPSYLAQQQSVYTLRTLATTPTLRHVLEYDGAPLLEFRPRRLARSSIRVLRAAADAAPIALLKRTRTAPAHGRAVLLAPGAAGTTLATLDWSRSPASRALDLDLRIAAPASASSPNSPTTPPQDVLPGARAAVALRIRSDGPGYASMAYEGRSLARFSRRPRLLGACEVTVDAGADVALVAIAAVAGMYALDTREDELEDADSDAPPSFGLSATSNSVNRAAPALHFEEMPQPATSEGGETRRRSFDVRGLSALVPGRRSHSSSRGRVGDSDSDGDGGRPRPALVAGRRSVSGARGRWEGGELL